MLLLATAGGMQILLPSHDEECFYEQIDAANKFTGSFEVISGGMQDIDVTVRIDTSKGVQAVLVPWATGAGASVPAVSLPKNLHGRPMTAELEELSWAYAFSRPACLQIYTCQHCRSDIGPLGRGALRRAAAEAGPLHRGGP